MGRTVPPYSFALADYFADLRPWCKRMSEADRRAFDQIFEAAHFHTTAGVMMSSPEPAEAIFVSAMLEQRKRLVGLSARMDEIEREVQAIRRR